MLRFSTGFRDLNNGMKAEVKGAVVGAGLLFVDGGSDPDSITDSGNGFIDAGFAPGDKLFVQGATTPGNDSGITGEAILTVAAGTITFATAKVALGEAGAVGTVVAVAKGGSLKNIFKDGTLRLYSGAQPSSADAAFSGTLLITLTESAGAFVAGAFGNGLEFEDDATDGVIEKASAEDWQGEGAADGVAGYFVFTGNAADTGAASTTLPRIMGNCGTSGSDLVMGSTTIVSGRKYTLSTFKLTLPEYYGA